MSAVSARTEIFTDGACRGNPGPGGWGVLLRHNGHEKRLYGAETGTTNNLYDAWFVGYTPGYITGVWAGLDGRELRSVLAGAADVAHFDGGKRLAERCVVQHEAVSEHRVEPGGAFGLVPRRNGWLIAVLAQLAEPPVQ